MSVTINPEIATLTEGSLCYSIYNQLYLNFFNAQDQKSESNPNGIVEGDSTSIRLKNTAYNFADAISDAVMGSTGDGSGGVMVGYLKKSGGDMSGLLRSNFGFEAGVDNTKIISVYKNLSESGLEVLGSLSITGGDLKIGGQKVLSYNGTTKTVLLSGENIDFGVAAIKSNGSIQFGDGLTGVRISSSGISIDNNSVYHSGNANTIQTDWTMRNANVEGSLGVNGDATISGTFKANGGAQISSNDIEIVSINSNGIFANQDIHFTDGNGIKVANKHVLAAVGLTDIQIGSVGGALILGNENTSEIKLGTGIKNSSGAHTIISKFGAGYFPDSFRAAHDFGSDLLATYKNTESDSGIVFYQNARFGGADGMRMRGDSNSISFYGLISRESGQTQHSYSIGFFESSSLYKPLDRESGSLLLSTDSDFFVFNKAVESLSIGITNSFTRLTDGILFLSEGCYLQSTQNGLKHYGDGIYLGDLRSEMFSTGFAGSGWGIVKNKTTGNYVITADEIEVRKKMRVYELEVQKQSATNGSLWVSDSCSGDTVIKL